MRGPATTAMILFQRFYMRHSFTVHDHTVSGGFMVEARRSFKDLFARLHPASSCFLSFVAPQIIATAALFFAAKVEEMHRRVRSLIDASFCVESGMERSPFDEASAEWRARRDAILEAERILLHTLEFDAAIDQPYPIITACLRKWKESGMFSGGLSSSSAAAGGVMSGGGGSSRGEKIPELQALDKAAGTLAFVCMAYDASLPLLFTTREIALGSLYCAYFSLGSVAMQQRLRIPESAFIGTGSSTNGSSNGNTPTAALSSSSASSPPPLIDVRLLTAFTERVADLVANLRRSEQRLYSALPLINELAAACRRSGAGGGSAMALDGSSVISSSLAFGATSSSASAAASSASGIPLSELPQPIAEAIAGRLGLPSVASFSSSSQQAPSSSPPAVSVVTSPFNLPSVASVASASIGSTSAAGASGAATTTGAGGIFGGFGASLLS